MRRSLFWTVCLLTGLVITAFSQGVARADLTPPSFTGTPDNSWAYFEQANAGHGESTTYYPTTTAEFAGAVFQGYVTYNAGSPPFYWSGQGTDSFEIFETYVTSTSDIVIPVRVGSDDGHSLFVNNTFIGGGGFGVDFFYNLSLQANTPTLITVAGYNGPGGWEFGIRDPANDEPLDKLPGITISASLVPEPSTLFAALVGALGFVVCGYWRRSRSETSDPSSQSA
jgi:hypothetical protein